jgi:3',5'-cyclic AMP phosphodiesterase CpdA
VPDTCILRFRDIMTDDTVRDHRDVISSFGYVWWGWWKKDFEPERPKELEELRERARTRSLSIGLFNWPKPAYFRAEIADCIFSAGACASPEPNKTPTYYSTDKVAAWFKITSIEELNEADFASRFTGPSVGEMTFFPIWHGDQSRNVTSAASNEVVSLSSSTILHLSDLHFGADYGYPTHTGPGQMPLLDLIEQDFRDEKPGLIVVSGDFTTRADANVLLADASTFLVQLSTRLKVPRECFVLVPGNHDVALQKWKPQDYSHETAFHLFVKEFHGKPHRFPELRCYRLQDGRQLEVLTINSVRLRHEREKQFGYVEWALYDALLRTKPHNPDVIRMAVLHHHLVPAPREEILDVNYPEASVSTTLDAGRVIEGLQEHGFTFALHGHQHVPAVSRVTRALALMGSGAEVLGKGLLVLAAGSAGACAHRLSDEMRENSYNVVRLRAGKEENESRRYTPGSAPQTLRRLRISAS